MSSKRPEELPDAYEKQAGEKCGVAALAWAVPALCDPPGSATFKAMLNSVKVTFDGAYGFLFFTELVKGAHAHIPA